MSSMEKKKNMICKLYLQGRCTKEEGCEFEHVSRKQRLLKRQKIWKDIRKQKKLLPELEFSYTDDNGQPFSLITKLKGHTKGISGIVMPPGHELYSASEDNTIRIWDCNTGECVDTQTSTRVGSILSQDPWVFTGSPNILWALDLKNEKLYKLDGLLHHGQTHCIAFHGDMLFAGTELGTIVTWRWRPNTKRFQLTRELKGSTGRVYSILTDGARLYSASNDGSIRVWNIETSKCIQTIQGHTKEITSLFFIWNNSIIVSASMDHIIKFWGVTESGNLVLQHERKEDFGVIALAGMVDKNNQTVLLCSCEDHNVRLYDLPSFKERGRIFSKDVIQLIETGIQYLFFTGNAAGDVSVWRLI